MNLVQIGSYPCYCLCALFEVSVGVVDEAVGEIVDIADHEVALVELLETKCEDGSTWQFGWRLSRCKLAIISTICS